MYVMMIDRFSSKIWIWINIHKVHSFLIFYIIILACCSVINIFSPLLLFNNSLYCTTAMGVSKLEFLYIGIRSVHYISDTFAVNHVSRILNSISSANTSILWSLCKEFITPLVVFDCIVAFFYKLWSLLK